MTQELGLLELVLGASVLVQIVMLILVVASTASWFLIIQQTMLMRRTDDELLSFEERFWSGIDLAQLYREGIRLLQMVNYRREWKVFSRRVQGVFAAIATVRY